ncbi:diaminopimelate epimerase [Vulcanococcus sp. Clear-D1]|uniref:diaminopimelate epimerase n=1 Tax=Vulcanococcus sp. Clear-D1 TaxID=2766970 RepID=UPI0019C9EDEA|nr:diaminopimelate epimerase [Vulcanococcus sp. Clear-D1]MBD1193589.1 diaminopimelate epimerase [Vulcanococcus sp. Clear-D1]
MSSPSKTPFSSLQAELSFSKYQGLGNDFLMLDGRAASDPDFVFGLTPALVVELCDRRFGVGGDGVILALPPNNGGELRMRIFNADGTEPEMCGNGIRCLARFLADRDGDGPGRTWQIDTLAGRIVPELLPDGTIRVDMGAPFLEPAQVPTTLESGPAGLPQGELEVDGECFAVAAAGMGNPHAVIPVPLVEEIDLERFGALLEVHPAFPAKTNVHFVQVLAPDHLVMRVWERGAGPTLACGTGACATLVACHSLGLCERRARLDLPGGPLQIHWDAASGKVFMDGPAEHVFDAVIPDPRAVADARSQAAGQASAEATATAPDPKPTPVAAAPEIDCATVCTNGCIRPDNCPSAEARARVAALLSGSSLDDLVTLATNTLESRTRARFERDTGLGS